MNQIRTGNTNIDGQDTRQWLVGSFMPEGDLRNTDYVEVKWGNHLKGEKREDWVTGETRTTIGILVSGKFSVEFPEKNIELSKQGDYVMWGPSVDHRWEALEDSVFLTIRWPSINETPH